MKRITVLILLSSFSLILPPSAPAQKETDERPAKEIYTGTIVSMSGGLLSTGFTLTLEGRTSDDEVQTKQVAPTILKLLGLDPQGLDAVRIEGTAVLPDLL